MKRVIKDNLKPELIQECVNLLAAQQSESEAWLNAIPSNNTGTFMNDNELRICIALRLGCKSCQAHTCICTERVNSDGLHGLSCSKSKGSMETAVSI